MEFAASLIYVSQRGGDVPLHRAHGFQTPRIATLLPSSFKAGVGFDGKSTLLLSRPLAVQAQTSNQLNLSVQYRRLLSALTFPCKVGCQTVVASSLITDDEQAPCLRPPSEDTEIHP